MPAPDKKKKLSYECLEDHSVLLSLMIGNAQYGLSDVRKNGTLLVRDVRIVEQPLGTGADLAKSTVIVRTIVNDINPSSNKAIVSYMLAGGPQPTAFQLTDEVEAHGEHLYFRVELDFRIAAEA